MPAGVAGFLCKEPLFGPVREGEYTLLRGLARDGADIVPVCLEPRARSYFAAGLGSEGFADGN